MTHCRFSPEQLIQIKLEVRSHAGHCCSCRMHFTYPLIFFICSFICSFIYTEISHFKALCLLGDQLEVSINQDIVLVVLERELEDLQRQTILVQKSQSVSVLFFTPFLEQDKFIKSLDNIRSEMLHGDALPGAASGGTNYAPVFGKME